MPAARPVPSARPPALVRALPRKLVSRLLGRLGRLEPPAFLLQAVLRRYARHFGVDREEMAQPLQAYRSFLGFFTRPLKPGLRPQAADPEVIGSPADGTVQNAGRVENGTLLQVKGVPYGVGALLGDAEAAQAFEGGSFLTAYLSPGDYHRFHWSFHATIETVRHLPGDLWPVNARAVAGVPGLFVRNERVVILGRTRGGHAFAYVPVGALNVGSIRLAFHPLRTNRSRAARPRVFDVPGLPVSRGDECGWFEFGSSIVLLLAPGGGQLEPLAPGTRLRVGQPIGRLARASSLRAT